MNLLDRFIDQTGKKPADWTSQDIQRYLNYLREQLAEAAAVRRYDH